MKKKLAIASLILLLAPTLVFVPLYALMINAKNTNVRDYENKVVGSWEAFQYYRGSGRVVCDETDFMSITFDEGTLTVGGTVLPEFEGPYSWRGGAAVTYGANGQGDDFETLYVSFDSRDNLRLETGDGAFIVLLRRVEE